MRRLNRALVVGGAGFFGSWLVETLVAEGVETTVLDEGPGADLPTNADVLDGDVVDIDLLSILDGRKIDAVFHLAGSGAVPQTLLHPIDDLHRNTTTTLAVLEAVRHSERRPLVAYVSSAAVYGEGERMPMREDHPMNPVSPYGISKLASERYVSLYSDLYEIPAFSARPFSLYGPRQRKLVVYDLLTRALDGEIPLTVLGSAEITRDFVFVDDAARALVTLARAVPARGEAYNVASGRPTALGDLVATLLEVAGLPAGARFTGTVRPGDPLRWEGDPARAQEFGARCEMPLDEGLRRTAEWVMRVRESEAVV